MYSDSGQEKEKENRARFSLLSGIVWEAKQGSKGGSRSRKKGVRVKVMVGVRVRVSVRVSVIVREGGREGLFLFLLLSQSH